MFHVWNIYLHLDQIYGKNRGKYPVHGAYGKTILEHVFFETLVWSKEFGIN